MTKQEFESTKEWLEKVTSLTFDGTDRDGDDEAVFADGIAYFHKNFGYDDGIVTLIFSDDANGEYAETTIRTNGIEVSVALHSSPNHRLSVEVFEHIVYHN